MLDRPLAYLYTSARRRLNADPDSWVREPHAVMLVSEQMGREPALRADNEACVLSAVDPALWGEICPIQARVMTKSTLGSITYHKAVADDAVFGPDEHAVENYKRIVGLLYLRTHSTHLGKSDMVGFTTGLGLPLIRDKTFTLRCQWDVDMGIFTLP